MANPAFASPVNPHFFQPLLPGFHNHLNIPVRFFVKNIEGKNENRKAKLRSDLSHKTWEVKLDGQRFTDGWEDFAVNHDFRVGDIIVFRQEGDMVFHVTGFGPSCCNLQYNITENIFGHENVEKNSRAEAEPSSSHSCFVAHVTVSNLSTDRLVLPRSFARSNGLNNRCCEIALMNEHGGSWTLRLRHRKSREGAYIEHGWRRFCHANGQKAGHFFTLKMVRHGTTPALQLSTTECGNNFNPKKHSGAKDVNFNSKRSSNKDRSSSGECSKRKAKTRARWRVSSSMRRNRLLTLILSPKILRDCYLRLPRPFTRENGIHKTGQITLLDKRGVEWPTTLWMEKKTGIMGLGKGLRGFFGAIRAREGDSIVMNLSWRNTTPLLKLCSKITYDTKPEECETVAEATDQMANDKQNIRETLTTPKVLVKEEQCLGAPKPESSAFECVNNPTPAKRFRTREAKISSKKRSGRDERSSGEGLNRKEKRTRKTWRLSNSPRQNRFATVTLTPYCMEKGKLGLPTKFMKVNGIERPRKIILRNKDGVNSPNSLVYLGQGRMGLGTGWKGFCEANEVKTGESFMVKLTWEDKTPVLWFCSKIKTE